MAEKYITIDLMGGIGNQMFQIALLYGIADQLGRKIILQRNQFSGCHQGSHPSNYYNTFFDKIQFQNHVHSDHTVREVQWLHYDIIQDLKRYDHVPCLRLNGYFQSDKYFKHVSAGIKKLFTPNCDIKTYLKTNSNIFEKYPELFEENDYCVICVRRGDYIQFPNIHNPCGMTYFNAAMSKMNKERYYIISDDINWTKSKFVGDSYRFIENGNDICDFMTMMLFKNFIISNSTYHWWGSYLSIYDSPRIIAPDKWLQSYSVAENTIYRDDMEVLERPVEV